MAPATGFALMGAGRGLWARLARAFGREDAAAREEAERILLEADFGPAAADEILSRVASVSADDRQAALEAAVTTALAAPAAPGIARAAVPPTVVVVFGVNGVGKTTTIAKLSHRLRAEGRSVLLAAADTFRAGAVMQLRTWAERLGVECVGGRDGGDPAAVAFDALEAARARGRDTLIVDTAGRLHTEHSLLEELKKVVRVLGQRHPGAPHESLLVLDGTVGQNAVHQARTFAAAVPLTGLIVTKLDGSARGGAVAALRRELDLPIRFLGVGEGVDDLQAFDPQRFAAHLLAESPS